MTDTSNMTPEELNEEFLRRQELEEARTVVDEVTQDTGMTDEEKEAYYGQITNTNEYGI